MSEPFLGEIKLIGFGFAPRGWAECNGQILPIAQNSALFSLLGTTFGGDGRSTFALPDLRGRSALHVGTGPGLSPIRWGQRGGAENHTLTTQQMPSHSHPLQNNAVESGADQSDPANHALAEADIYSDATPGARTLPANTGNSGGSQSFSIRDPFLGIYHVIALTGLFPSRS